MRFKYTGVSFFFTVNPIPTYIVIKIKTSGFEILV